MSLFNPVFTLRNTRPSVTFVTTDRYKTVTVGDVWKLNNTIIVIVALYDQGFTAINMPMDNDGSWIDVITYTSSFSNDMVRHFQRLSLSHVLLKAARAKLSDVDRDYMQRYNWKDPFFDNPS